MVDVIIPVNDEISDHYRGILESIKRAGSVPIDELKELGNDHPGLQSLEVDRYTIGPTFFRYGSRKREEVYKRALAKSFMDRCKARRGSELKLGNTVIQLETRGAEEKFKEWQDEAVPQRDRYFEDEIDKCDHQDIYRTEGNFVVECLFILEVILRLTCGDGRNSIKLLLEGDGRSSIKLLLKARRDLIIYDNQLPFIILENLFDLTFPSYGASDDKNFVKLCVNLFNDCMLITRESQVSPIIQQLQLQRTHKTEIRDFIDLVRKCHAPLLPRQPPEHPLELIAMKKATYLEQAGMTIKPASTDSTVSVCNLRYSRGRLHIPKFRINNKSGHLLRNLMEYEIQNYPAETFIIDYVHFISSIIDTDNDVDVLIHNDILVNFLPKSKEVVELFDTITKEAPFIARNYYYHGISADVNTFCQIPRHRWKATLRRDYCNTPCMAASTIGAIILLVLTLIRTVLYIIDR